MKRLPLWSLLISLIAIACLIPVVGQTTQLDPSTLPDHVMLNWSDNPATTMTISWHTDASVTTGQVQYQEGCKLSSDAICVNATSSKFSTDLGNTQLFTAKLAGLSPNTKFSYRAGDGKHWSTAHTFTTADPQSRQFKFLVFGDSQSSSGGSSPYPEWRDTVHNAYKANPDSKFFVNVGDLVDTGQSGAHWNGWFSAAAGVIDSIPVMPVVGNHETYGSDSTSRPEYWKMQFRLPQNGPASLRNQVYSYDYGPVHFVVLDSQGDEQRQYGNMFALEKKWLDNDLARSKATWKIVFFHKTPYPVHIDRTSSSVKNAFCATMERYHVDLVFNGHDHGVARTYPITNGVSGTKPSDGIIYYLAGRSGSKRYGELERKPWNSFFYNPQDQPNYVVVEVADTKLTVKAIKQDGTLIDAICIDKKKDAISKVRK